MRTTASCCGCRHPQHTAHTRVWHAPHFANLALPATPEEARTIRHWSAHALTRWGMRGSELDDALLVIGEFAANAVEHGGEDMSIALTLEGDLLTVAVSDNGTTEPEEIPRGSAAQERNGARDRGRGLVLVDALSLAWGASALIGGGVILNAELRAHP